MKGKRTNLILTTVLVLGMIPVTGYAVEDSEKTQLSSMEQVTIPESILESTTQSDRENSVIDTTVMDSSELIQAEETDSYEEAKSETDESNSVEESSESKDENLVEPDGEIEMYPSEQGRSDLYESNSASARGVKRQALPVINPTDKNRPKMDFIDISSHNGALTVDNFKKIKSYGVKGVTIKLTEYTSYQNPFAKTQINNAKAAGLIVSAYHYSWFTTEAEARAEAEYFAAYANSLNLPKTTVMVNDIEEPSIANTADHTANSLAFTKRLNELGFKNTRHYVGKNWIETGKVNANTLGKKNVWIAAYPYNPTSTQQNTEYGAWQWTSLVTFPGISSYFDMSSDYTSAFTTQLSPTPTPANYYQTNPDYVMLKKSDYVYSSVNFNASTRGKKVEKDTIVKVTGIKQTSGGTPRLVVEGGYLTANMNYVVKVSASYKNYYTAVPTSGYVYTKVKDTSYTNTAFTTKKNSYAINSSLKVSGIEFTATGIPRLRLSDGTYFTANKNRVGTLTANYANYYYSNPGYIVMKKADYYYSDINFKNKGNKINKGTVLKVTGIQFTASGVPRIKTSMGYVTANKKYINKIAGSYANYYTNVNKVKLVKADYSYSSVDFTSGTRKKKMSANTILTVTDIHYTSSGVPRLKTSSGYITANKKIVNSVK